MTEKEQLLKNLKTINRRIEMACRKKDRNPEHIKLLLATKTVSPDRIITALEAGQTFIGENKVQEIKEKFEALENIPHETHFIGHLQSNKIKDILKYNVSCVQSIDRLSLAEKLQARLEREDKEIDVLIQVNTSGEVSKFGIAPQYALKLVQDVAKLDRIHIKGLMTIGLFSDNTEKVRLCFQRLKNLQLVIGSLRIPGVSMKELSMGMSGDLEVAIEEGATIIRVGTAIFGERIYPDSYYWPEANEA